MLSPQNKVVSPYIETSLKFLEQYVENELKGSTPSKMKRKLEFESPSPKKTKIEPEETLQVVEKETLTLVDRKRKREDIRQGEKKVLKNTYSTGIGEPRV